MRLNNRDSIRTQSILYFQYFSGHIGFCQCWSIRPILGLPTVLQLDDDGGNNFKRLNRSIDLYLGEREGKTSNIGCYIHAAKLLRAKIFPDIKIPDGNIWNTDQATSYHQELRTRYEDKLCTLLEMDVVNNFEHLKP